MAWSKNTHPSAGISIALIVSILSQVGCYDWEIVRPAEISRLSTSVGTQGEQADNNPIESVDVERPDGSLVHITSDRDIRITVRGGTVYHFTSPIAAVRKGDVLVLRGGNRGETRIPIGDIEKAEVSQYSDGKTMLTCLGVSALLVGLIAVVVVAEKDSRQ